MSRRVVAGVAAVVLAVAGTAAVFAYAHNADSRALQGQEAVAAYVVRKDVPAGTTAREAVKDGLIVKEMIASKGVPEGTLTTVDAGNGSLMATDDLHPGELVLAARFAEQVAVQGRVVVPEGKMAVSLALDDAAHVGPFLTVGSHIAVFDTFNVLESDTKDQTPAGDHLQDRHEFLRSTRLLIPDAVVLAVGTTTTRAEAKSSKDSGDSDLQDVAAQTGMAQLLVTLALTQDQAQRAIHAAHTGTITFALLGADGAATPGAGVDDRRLFTGIKP